jgi:hypothetical protein
METKKKLTNKYRITGIDKQGRRFTPIDTTTPQHYNIYRGTLWQLYDDGSKKFIKTYY